MKSSQDDLATRLARQREERAYRRRRSIRQFGHRMRAAGILAGLFFGLVIYLLSLLVERYHLDYLAVTIRPVYLTAWLYFIFLPLLFGWRTGLWAYVLREHWVWLAAWIAVPLDFYVIRFSIPGWRWLPILFLGLLVLGHWLRHWRERRYDQEIEMQAQRWDRLLPLGVLDLLMVGFW